MIGFAKDILKEAEVKNVNSKITVINILPSDLELNSSGVKDNVYDLITTLSNMADNNEIGSLLFLDNAKATKHEKYKKLPPKKFYPAINQYAANIYQIFNRICKSSGIGSNFDPADYEAVLNAGGHLVMNQIRIPGKTIMSDVDQWEPDINWIQQNPIFVDCFNYKTAKNVGLVIAGSDVIMDEIATDKWLNLQTNITSFMNNAKFTTGIYYKKDKIIKPEEGSIDIYIIIGGLSKPESYYDKFK